MPRKLLRSQEGQVSILIAIIFQVVFVFFAMVVNVGLLVHDKINLQNSVDIAAYYAAMKQAEVLNAMAQVNYQTRQLWKLMAWRVWALGDAGRNLSLVSGIFDDIPAVWRPGSNGIPVDEPLICVVNPLWFEYKTVKGNENQCQNTALNFTPPTPIDLSGAQPLFAGILAGFSQNTRLAANFFNADVGSSGPSNYAMAAKIIISYKLALANRKKAMRALEAMLIDPGDPTLGAPLPANDFRDLSGNSVYTGVQKTIKNNLTSANLKSNIDIEFHNSLAGKPFLVPIETRAFLRYLDIFNTSPRGGATRSVPKSIRTPPSMFTQGRNPQLAELIQIVQTLTDPDYDRYPPDTAASFYRTGDPTFKNDFKTVVGFEKNPWILAYIHIKATTHPSMLFAPNGGKPVTLTAEAYAMPFGGRIGPWYSDAWQRGFELSQSGSAIDKLLPARVGSGMIVNEDPPNYSRYPGDQLGMRSQAARSFGLLSVYGTVPELPHLTDNDYAFIVPDPADMGQDPIVDRQPLGTISRVRSAEIAAVAPDLFDAIYYSVDPHFSHSVNRNGGFFFNVVCPACHDLGSRKLGGRVDDTEISQQVGTASGFGTHAFWLVQDTKQLMTGWNQAAADDFNTSRVGLPEQDRGNGQVGRVGYSVKVVSRHFLESPLPLGGNGGGSGVILNPPAWSD